MGAAMLRARRRIREKHATELELVELTGLGFRYVAGKVIIPLRFQIRCDSVFS
jgi:hypothetical protein